MFDGVKSFYNLSKILSFCVGASTVLFVIVPILFIALQLIQGKNDIILISAVPSKFPWSSDDNYLLWIFEYLTYVVAGLTLYTVTCGVDALFSFYIFQMTSKLRIMSDEMKNLNTNNYYHTIRDCSINYENLSKCRNIIENIYGPIILWTITTNAIVLCALIFQLSRVSFLL